MGKAGTGDGGRLRVGQIGAEGRAVTLTPDEAGRAALAERLGVDAILALRCAFHLRRPGNGTRVLADGALEATLVQRDVRTLAPFTARVSEVFQLRFMPEAALPPVLDIEDPVDDVGYVDETIDLHEAMAEQLALTLDPYPRDEQGGSV